ncbi:MAG: hypothetical protein QWI73_06310, partial [Alphaproteobacteria bacterium]|nr:hypothetical protein [Alphaproteobacteria bacterium]
SLLSRFRSVLIRFFGRWLFFFFFIQVAVTRDGIAMLTASNRLLLELKNQQQQLLTVGQYGILLTLLLDSFPSTEKCLRYN